MFKKATGILLCLFLFVGILAGCNEVPEDYDVSPSTAESSQETATESVSTDNSSEETWTILLYLCGTDLESEYGAATLNLQEVSDAYISDNINFIIQTGGTSQWMNEMISSDKLQRFQATDDNFILVDELDLASMGDPSTLGDFLTWGTETYPADKYMAIFWNHGGGSVSGVQSDELFEGDTLILTELSQGLAQSGVEFEAIGFDTCLMATLENAEAISPYGKYMVASEEYEPGGGWDYTTWLNYLSTNLDASGADLGTVICDSFYEKCKNNGEEEMATLSVVDLGKIDTLSASFKEMATEMTGITGDVSSFQQLARGAMRAENYGGNTDEEGYTNMVDLGDLVSKTQDVLTEASDNILSALSDAVVYQIKGSNRKAGSGISVFFPLAVDSDTCDQYAALSGHPEYLQFIDAMTANWTAPEWIYDNTDQVITPVTSDDYSVIFSNQVTDDGYFTLTVTEGLEIIESVNFSLYYMDYDYEEFLLLGLDNDISADWDTGSFEDNFRGVWITIGDSYISPTLIAEEDSYNLYSVPVILNGNQTNLRISYDFDIEEFTILGAYDGIDQNTGMSSRDIKKLTAGDEITFLFDAIDMASGEVTTYESGSLIYSDDTVITESPLFDGEYLYQYEITDIFGNKYYSDYAIMECKDGEIFVSEAE